MKHSIFLTGRRKHFACANTSVYLGPKPFCLLSDQLSQVCALCVQYCIEGGLMVSCLSGHTGALQPALPYQLLVRWPMEK